MNKWKKINKSRLFKFGLLALAAAFAILLTANAAVAASIPTSHPYWEQTVEYHWDIVKTASLDEVVLDRDENVEIDYLLQVSRTAEVSDVVGIRGNTGWLSKVSVYAGTKKLVEETVEKYSDYDLQFTPVEGVNTYFIKFSSANSMLTYNFSLPKAPEEKLAGEAIAVLTDTFTYPDDSGLAFTKDPDETNTWILGENEDEDFSQDIEYTLTIANVQADYEAEFSVENTAVLTPQYRTLAIEEPTTLASASATVKILTASEPVEDPGDDPGEEPKVPEELPKTGTDFGMFSILGSALVTMGLALLRRR